MTVAARPANTADVIIVGSGASGSFAAMELTRQGLNVLLIEAGPEVTPETFRASTPPPPASGALNLAARLRAAMRGQHVQARVSLFDDRVAPFYVNDRKHPYTTPPDAPYLWFRGRQGGGRLQTFGRVLMRWSDDDFRMFSRTGTGVDWPICHDDLAPYYAEVESFLGLHGQTDSVETLPDSVIAHPADLTAAETHFKRAVEHHDPARRVISRRFMLPEGSDLPKPLATALATGRLSIRYNTAARRILRDSATGRATGVACIDTETGRTREYHAAAVVLSASAVESVRLLLLSGGPGDGGLGNSSGLLGRYFMDQLPSIAVGNFPAFRGFEPDGVTPENPHPFQHVPGGIFIPRLLPQEGEQRPRSYTFQGKIARSEVPEEAAARFTFMGYGQMIPDPDNRITLDPRKRDALSIPAPHIRCAISPGDEATLKTMKTALEEMVARAGGELEFIGSPLGLTEMGRGAYPDAGVVTRMVFRRLFSRGMAMGSAIHESGGARMGADPRSSVVDPWCRLHDVKNVLVTDAASFPTGGVAGPTLTIMASTVRACRRLAQDLRAGGNQPSEPRKT